MKRYRVAAALAATALSVTLSAQKITPMKTGSRGSEHVRAEWTVDGANIAVEYGRPALKGRVPGKDVDPFEGKEWRTGADEQTTLVTDKVLKFGSLVVPAGTYGIHTIPVNGTWQLIISKRTKGWGIPYPRGEDLGRAPMTMGKSSPSVDKLTIAVDDTSSGGTLNIHWGDTKASIPFTVG